MIRKFLIFASLAGFLLAVSTHARSLRQKSRRISSRVRKSNPSPER